MKSYIPKGLLIIGLLSSVVFTSITSAVESIPPAPSRVRFYVLPRIARLEAKDTFQVKVFANTGDRRVNAVDMHLTYDAADLSFGSVNFNNGSFDVDSFSTDLPKKVDWYYLTPMGF